MSKLKYVPICVCLLVSLLRSQDKIDSLQTPGGKTNENSSTDSLLAEFPWDDYELRTIKEIIANNHKAVREEGTGFFLVERNGHPSKIKVKYLGKIRDISDSKNMLLMFWTKTFGIPERFYHLFTKEILVNESGKKYWIPIQKQMIPFLINEIKDGDEFFIYMKWPGAVVRPFTTEWVFIINEFAQIKE